MVALSRDDKKGDESGKRKRAPDANTLRHANVPRKCNGGRKMQAGNTTACDFTAGTQNPEILAENSGVRGMPAGEGVCPIDLWVTSTLTLLTFLRIDRRARQSEWWKWISWEREGTT